MEWENKIYEGIHYSRFIASWVKSGGQARYILEWLKKLLINGKPIPENIIQEIYELANCGKPELITHAMLYLKGEEGL